MNQQPHEIVWTMTNAALVSRCLHVMAEVGVADLIAEEPVSVEELARKCAADPDALDRSLRLLAAHGIFRDSGGAYEHTAASRLLRSDHPMSMRAFPRMMGLPVFWTSFGALEHSIRTGSPALEQVAPQGLWPYLQDHPGEAEVFGAAMTAKAAGDTAAVLGAYDFSGFGTIADVGGGRGHLLRAVLDAAPDAAGVLFDLPHVIDAFALPASRITTHAGDFFVDPLPAADAYLLMDVIHDWADAEAVAILGAVRRAAPPGARVLIIEAVASDGQPDPHVQTLDIIMLAITGGRERTASRFAKLLDSAGLRLSTVVETPGPLRIVEATAA